MNNLGGYKKIELYFADEVSSFTRAGQTVALVLPATANRVLPLSDEGAELSATAETEDGGMIYTHECTVYIRYAGLGAALRRELAQVAARGCILIGTTSNGERRVFGSVEYPLHGSFRESYGEKRADPHRCELSLSARMLHGELRMP